MKIEFYQNSLPLFDLILIPESQEDRVLLGTFLSPRYAREKLSGEWELMIKSASFQDGYYKSVIVGWDEKKATKGEMNEQN